MNSDDLLYAFQLVFARGLLLGVLFGIPVWEGIIRPVLVRIWDRYFDRFFRLHLIRAVRRDPKMKAAILKLRRERRAA